MKVARLDELLYGLPDRPFETRRLGLDEAEASYHVDHQGFYTAVRKGRHTLLVVAPLNRFLVRLPQDRDLATRREFAIAAMMHLSRLGPKGYAVMAEHDSYVLRVPVPAQTPHQVGRTAPVRFSRSVYADPTIPYEFSVMPDGPTPDLMLDLIQEGI